jgi:spermidine/putrescine transport system permease protein
MSVDTSTKGFGWRAVQAFTVLVYIFMFAPILVVIVLSFNASQFGGFPMTGFSLHWYAKLMENDSVLRAFQTSLWVAVVTSIVCSVLGILAAVACAMTFPARSG